MEGGKIDNTELIHRANYRNTRSLKNNKKKQNTRKNHKRTNHFKERMNMPIGTSSFKIVLTPEMIAANERYSKDIDQYIKNGLINYI